MRIVTGADLRAAREKLGWTTYQMGRALRLTGDRHRVGLRVHRMETEAEAPIGGPTATLVEAFLDGWRPEGFALD